jgi:hypothetical protein
MTDKLNVFDIHVHQFLYDTCEQETDKHCIIFLLLNNKFYQRPLTTLVSLLTSSAVDCGVKPKNIKLGFASFPLSTQYKEASSKTGWLRIWIVFEWSQLSTRGMLFQ